MNSFAHFLNVITGVFGICAILVGVAIGFTRRSQRGRSESDGGVNSWSGSGSDGDSHHSGHDGGGWGGDSGGDSGGGHGGGD